MIKNAVVTPETPSVVSGRRGTVVVHGEAVRKDEQLPEELRKDLRVELPTNSTPADSPSE